MYVFQIFIHIIFLLHSTFISYLQWYYIFLQVNESFRLFIHTDNVLLFSTIYCQSYIFIHKIKFIKLYYGCYFYRQMLIVIIGCVEEKIVSIKGQIMYLFHEIPSMS